MYKYAVVIISLCVVAACGSGDASMEGDANAASSTSSSSSSSSNNSSSSGAANSSSSSSSSSSSASTSSSSSSASSTSASSSGDGVGSKPNILLIISDDQGIDASAQYSLSNDLPDTPVLNALAQQGLVFENVWATPACTTTRGTLLTGKYAVNSKVDTVPDLLESDQQTLQDYLANNTLTSDYSSAVIGKWHVAGQGASLTHPNESGVPYFAGPIGNHRDYFSWDLVINGTSENTTVYNTTKLTDLGIEWVRNQNGPWFLWMAYNAPHGPVHLPPADLHERSNLSGDEADIADNPRPYFLAAIEALDKEIGRLLDSLSQAERDNTIILYVSDNGTPRRMIDRTAFIGAHGKGSLYEGGVRVPMVVSGKGVTRQNEREDALINTTDFFATIAELAGAQIKSIHDSRSFAEHFTDASAPERDYIFAEVNDDVAGWAIRSKTHKLINFNGGSQELYDLRSEITESNNLINEASSANIVSELENAAKAILGEIVIGPDPVDPMGENITNIILTRKTANCADYVSNYQSMVMDVNRNLLFNGALTITTENDKCIFQTNIIPNHDFNDGVMSFPNNVSAQNKSFEITADPQKAIIPTPLTLVTDNAILLNGVKVDLLAAACFNVGNERVGCNDINQPWRFDPMHAANGFRIDSHNAHTQPDGTYHYHGPPNALFDDSTALESPVIGFAADGFPIYGSFFNDAGTVRKATSSYQLKMGERPSSAGNPGGTYDGTYRDDYEYVAGTGDLDECNGMEVSGVYGYYITETYPYILGCYTGTPDTSFNKR